MIVERGLSGSTFAKHSRRSPCPYGDKLVNEVPTPQKQCQNIICDQRHIVRLNNDR